MDLVLITDKFLFGLQQLADGATDFISIPHFVQQHGGNQVLLRRIAEAQDFQVKADGCVYMPS